MEDNILEKIDDISSQLRRIKEKLNNSNNITTSKAEGNEVKKNKTSFIRILTTNLFSIFKDRKNEQH